MDETEANDSRAEFLASIRRLTTVILDRLASSTSVAEMDEKETRMLSSIAMRSLGIWEKALPTENNDRDSQKERDQNRKPRPKQTDRQEQ